MESETTTLDDFVGILSHPEQRLLPLLHPTTKSIDSINNDTNKNTKSITQKELLDTCQYLFKEIEGLAQSYKSLVTKKKKRKNKNKEEETKTDNNSSSLSGLSELYIPSTATATTTTTTTTSTKKKKKKKSRKENNDNIANHTPIDAETIWGQVELQNDALKSLIQKSVKKLTKSHDKIRVLDMDSILSDDEDDEDDDVENNSDNDEMNDNNSEVEEEDDEEEDEATRRIRERMERTMNDMDDDDDDDDDDENVDLFSNKKDKQSNEKDNDNDESSLIDPVAEDLKDGFFDLNEMEDFADEEEEFLPDEAWGTPRPEKKNKNNLSGEEKKKSFHQKLRDGDLLEGQSDDDSNNDDSDDGDEFNFDDYDEPPIRRKKYREDDEIKALYSLYDESTKFNDEEEDDRIVNMTAADFFGQPKKKYYERYYKQRKKPQTTTEETPQKNDDDDDSWGDYDFEKEDQAVGWRDDVKTSKKGDDDDDEENNEDDQDMEDEQEEEEEDEEEGGSSNKNDGGDTTSRHAKNTEKLRRQTEEIEKEMLREKPWQMVGETTSTDRPMNSLLEGTPEFQLATKQAPIITIEHTTNLEDIIKNRILNEDWDDVIPRELPDVGWHKKRGELPEVSQEKSKLGLGELYEREYLKKAIGYDKDAVEKQTEEDKAKDEMKQLFANLCSKLDALSNYHFAPRPIAEEADVRPVTTPAIAMEEVLPLHVSDSRGVAPEEVYGKKHGRDGVLRAETELDQTDRKRLRSSKKAARRKKRKEKLADEKLISRLSPGLGLNNPYEKRKLREELSESRARGKVMTAEYDDINNSKFGSSGTFFKRLQSEAQQSIRSKEETSNNDYDNNNEKSSKPKSSSYKL